MAQLLMDIQADRAALSPGEFGPTVDTQHVQTALTRLHGSIQMKLHWVNELPYLIWQARSSGVWEHDLSYEPYPKSLRVSIRHRFVLSVHVLMLSFVCLFVCVLKGRSAGCG